MRRIGLAVVFALSLLLAPVAAEAQQQAEKVYRVGWILSGPPGPLATAFRLGLREHGHAEGQNLIFETRYDEGQPQRLPELVAELVRLRADVIFAIGDQMTKATKDATTTIPIVMLACDAVAAGFVSSLARPGGNITGITCISSEIAEFTSRSRTPAIYAYRQFVDSGGLISYGPSLKELWRGAAVYVAKILKGAKPADLPVEQPTKFELVINLKTAKMLGLKIPPSVLGRADQVIE